MFSIPDMGILAVLALLIFGPEKLPGIMRNVGRVTREVQATSQGFIREMERAGDLGYEPPYEHAPPPEPEPDVAAAPAEADISTPFDDIPSDDPQEYVPTQQLPLVHAPEANEEKRAPRE
ncbi:MAG: twin-arginine translocase TatA/TatE family subunit [Candidatus Eremiobacteraeota bacterium]|nr:twin-arginine translocase TatA/TatE family subunit [Candidatus Eremiobacteraeota bacterium]